VVIVLCTLLSRPISYSHRLLMPPVNDEYIDSANDSEEEDQLNDEDYTLENVLRAPRVVSYSIEKLYGQPLSNSDSHNILSSFC
jgi:hypothetical protein